MESDYTPAHSLLVQQSGTGSPSSLSIGNNTLVGRLSGGGSNIDDLSASQVRTLLNVEDGADVTDAANVASTITGAAAKTTPVDADEIPIADSAASFGLKKLTFTNLKATLKTYLDTLYVALTGTQTIAGDKTFSGDAAFTSTTRPTSGGTGTPAATSLITRADAESLNLFANSYIKEMNQPEGSSSSATSGSGSAGLFGAEMVRVAGSTVASAWQRYHFGDYSMGAAVYFVGGGFPASRVFAVAFNAIITIPANDRSCFYAGYLGAFSDALPAPSAAALSSLGFCMRLYYSATNSRYEITLHAHNGTTLTNSSPVAVPITVNNSNTQSYIISTNGSGTVRLYSATASVGPISTTPLISITGGPSSGSYPAPFTFGIANGATPPASSASALITTSPKVHIGATY
jgi:hypothetical protein